MLITTMMIMVAVALLGLSATTTSIFEIQIASNERRATEQLFRADSSLNQQIMEEATPADSLMLGRKSCRQYVTDGDTPFNNFDLDNYGLDVDVYYTLKATTTTPVIHEYRICARGINNSIASITAGIIEGAPAGGFGGSGGTEY